MFARQAVRAPIRRPATSYVSSENRQDGLRRQPRRDRQARLCASAFADRQNVPINDVTVSGHDASPTGNTIVSLQSGVDKASCEITGAGRVVGLDVLREGTGPHPPRPLASYVSSEMSTRSCELR